MIEYSTREDLLEKIQSMKKEIDNLSSNIEDLLTFIAKEKPIENVGTGWHSLSIEERAGYMLHTPYGYNIKNVSQHLIWLYIDATQCNSEEYAHISKNSIINLIKMHDLEVAKEEVLMNQALE